MNKNEIFSILYDKDKTEVYKKFQEIKQNKECLKILYENFEDVCNMLFNDKSYIRIRGFIIICELSKDDRKDKINSNIDILLKMLDDEKPICVRQYLSAIIALIKYKPELKEKIRIRLNGIEYLKYSDSMSPLIKKDIDNILDYIG